VDLLHYAMTPTNCHPARSPHHQSVVILTILGHLLDRSQNQNTLQAIQLYSTRMRKTVLLPATEQDEEGSLGV